MDLWSTVSYSQSYANLDSTVRMRRSGCTICSNQILMRGRPEPQGAINRWDSFYGFQYMTSGSYSVYKSVGGTLTALQAWTSSPAIITGAEWNTLRVVANGTSLAFYINGTLVWSGTDTALTTGRVGIGMYNNVTSTGNLLEVDWATLSALPSGAGSGLGAILPEPVVGAELGGTVETAGGR
jgi:hypothetical protein